MFWSESEQKYQNLWDVSEAVLTQIFNFKRERYKINDPNIHLKKLEKE